MRFLLRSPRRMVLFLVDIAVILWSYWLAFVLRFETLYFGAQQWENFWATLPLAVVCLVAGMLYAGVYRGIWRYASINDLANIIRGAVYGSVIFILLVVFWKGSHGFPRSIFLIHAGLVICGIGGLRFARRLSSEFFETPRGERNGKRILIVGAGDAADDLLRELRQNPRMSYVAVGLVDDAPEKQGQQLHGVNVLGVVDDLPALARAKGAAEIMIAVPSASGAQMRRIVERCRETGLPYRTVPGIADILDERVHVSQLRRVKIEDLLRRKPASLDSQAIGAYLGGKTVLVTGAGGSIGSELCRQVAVFNPAEIVMLDHSENSLFYLAEEFERVFPKANHRVVVADVTARARMERIMGETRPDVVFHAAAHKHVTLMEGNPWAAIVNNVTGTRVTAQSASDAKVGKFVMISTDKAVNPSSVMGLTKRLAELVVQGMNARPGNRTTFCSVRFGNVMGSEGSVIPLFTRQIEAGGPVTVTHPEVTRYFMTIPEAAQLVLQAAAMGNGGEIFILDMGEQVKIVDLAREMITLSGLQPEVDIPIRFIGLRPGEKLYEELITGEEGVGPTPHQQIMVLHPNGTLPGVPIADEILTLESMAARCEPREELMAVVRELVPEYRSTDRSV